LIAGDAEPVEVFLVVLIGGVDESGGVLLVFLFDGVAELEEVFWVFLLGAVAGEVVLPLEISTDFLFLLEGVLLHCTSSFA
jgi:hypothetical protein